MEHIVETHFNGKIISATIDKTLTINDWKAVSLQIMHHVQATSDDVHVIVDMTNTKHHPLNALEIKRVTIWAAEENIKTVNHITTSAVTSTLGKIVISMVAQTYAVVDSLDSAYERIVSVDPNLRSVDELMKSL